ncbi:MAG: NAD(+)/NADH kinase [Clostridia bacterium]|nr:NAD(+)/NADH kinase [Clostridia bacterium]
MKLIIYTNPKKPNAAALLAELYRIAESRGIETEACASDLMLNQEPDEKWRGVTCVVTIGGDGTILRAVSAAAPHGVPVLGINMGRVGFFSEIGTDEFGEALTKLQKGEYTVESASMLTCLVNGECAGLCLNDFIIHRQELSSITQLGLSIDGDSVGGVMADGLIVATPSGSTGYTMSAGGPVVAPKLDCMLVTPICPHSLTIRPIVASADSAVTVKAESVCRLTRDGQDVCVIRPGDEIVFRKAERTAQFIRFGRRNVFRLIREKLK